MYAIANHLQDLDKVCPESTLTADQPSCDSCYNVYTHVAEWIDHTPEFDPLIVLVSSPIALLVALWGMSSKTLNMMTTKITLNILKKGQKQTLCPEHTEATTKVIFSPK